MWKMAQESNLAVATSWHDIGSTFFGDQKRSSRIDHVVLPQAALGLVCSRRTLPIAGRRLQPFHTRVRKEHIPIAIEIEVPLRCRPLSDRRIKIDRSELMQRNCRIGGMQVLDRRRDLREREGEEFEAVQALPKEIRALPKEAREQVNRRRTAALEDEIGEAWPDRHFAQLHSLRIEYARNGRGPKNGFYFSPRATWDREDWISSELDWDANYENYVRQCNELASEELPDDMNVDVAVAQERAAMLIYAKKAPKEELSQPGEFLKRHYISDRQCNI